jgi:hypothetical protein
MKRLVLLMLALTIAPATLHAQTVIVPAKPLDAPRARVRNTLLMVRDSLITVNSATARLQRDYRHTSAALLTQRARTVAEACARSSRVLPSARDAISQLVSDERQLHRTREGFLQAIDSLRTAMDRCQAEFAAMAVPGKGEEVRGYGNRRAEPIIDALNGYDAAANSYFKTWQMDVRPLGARPSPLAS